MTIDIREKAAKYYDCEPGDFGDLHFYQEHIARKPSDVLELGCGTGRILVPLARVANVIYGIDVSKEMLAICKQKMENASLTEAKAHIEVGDITDFSLGRRFDLIIAPFRVIQNLETDAQLAGMFQSIKKHLKWDGTCILNAFKPYLEWAKLVQEWRKQGEDLEWKVPFEGGILSRYCRRARIDEQQQVLYPDLIYRLRKQGQLVEETVLSIAMRCFYPTQFEQVIKSNGFRIVQKWGGYQMEKYGEGPELVIEFQIGG